MAENVAWIKAIENGLEVAAEYLDSDSPSADQKVNFLALTEMLCHFTTAICAAVSLGPLEPVADEEDKPAFDAKDFFDRLKNPPEETA